MKFLRTAAFTLSIVSSLGVLGIGSISRANDRIENLADLSPLLIHHFECRGAIVMDEPSGSQEGNFIVSTAGGQQTQEPTKIDLGKDELEASANSQLLQIKWSRDGKVIASAMTMIQNSPTQAYVLIAYDPANDSNQVSVSCQGITYADLKGNN